MSMATAIANAKALVDAISGVRTVTNVPESIPIAGPSCVAYPFSGRWTQDVISHPLDEAAHTIVIEVGVKRQDLPRDVATLMPFIESVRAAIAADQTLGGEVLAVTALSYQFGGPGVMMFSELGLRFALDVVLYEDV